MQQRSAGAHHARRSDGRPLEAKDVVWTFRRVLDKDLGSGSYSRFSRTMTPEGLSATDASTVTIKLKSPDSLLPYAFADPHTVIVQDGQATFDPRSYVGTGPYTLVSWVPGQSDERVRKACKLAVDRKAVLNTVYAGLGDVTSDIPLAPGEPTIRTGLESTPTTPIRPRACCPPPASRTGWTSICPAAAHGACPDREQRDLGAGAHPRGGARAGDTVAIVGESGSGK